MKANEFVKKYGWGESIAFLSLDSDVEIVYTASFFDDLKRLVESHELVESKGGLIKAKEILADNPVWCSGSKRYSSPLERAIADVESCTEAGKRLEVNQ